MTTVEEFSFAEMFKPNTFYHQEIPSYNNEPNYEQSSFVIQEQEFLQPPFQPQPNQSQSQSQLQNGAAFFPMLTEDEISYNTLLHQNVQLDQVNPSSFLFNQDATSFPPVDAFVPPHNGMIGQQLQLQHDNQQQLFYQSQLQRQPMQQTFQQQQFYQQQQTSHQQSHQFQIQQQFQQGFEKRNMSEPDLLTPMDERFALSTTESNFSLSPDSVTFSTISNSNLTSSLTIPSSPEFVSIDTGSKKQVKRYKVIRGISSGGSTTKPPKASIKPNHHYSPVVLDLIMARLEDLCLPQWNEFELQDKRRIIRVERYQIGPKIVAKFSIVGSSKENPKTLPSGPGIDVVEVSCLECYSRPSDDADEEEENSSSSYSYQQQSVFSNEIKRNFYITSVEVIKIVELLIGTESPDPVDRRRERGRIRSNLVPFWSKKPVSSRASQAELRSSPIPSDSTQDFRIELATRIMAYEDRKPRGFDKEVRILKWEKLVPALRRALQSYYAEIPDDFEENDDQF